MRASLVFWPGCLLCHPSPHKLQEGRLRQREILQATVKKVDVTIAVWLQAPCFPSLSLHSLSCKVRGCTKPVSSIWALHQNPLGSSYNTLMPRNISQHPEKFCSPTHGEGGEPCPHVGALWQRQKTIPADICLHVGSWRWGAGLGLPCGWIVLTHKKLGILGVVHTQSLSNFKWWCKCNFFLVSL